MPLLKLLARFAQDGRAIAALAIVGAILIVIGLILAYRPL